MKRNLWLTIFLIMLLYSAFFTASCAQKELVQTQSVPTIQPEPTKASDSTIEEAGQLEQLQENRIQKISDGVVQKAEPADQLQEDRLRAEAAAREAARKAFVKKNIHFTFDSSVLTEQAQQILKSKADYLRSDLYPKVTIEGHCDERGTDGYNINLGKRRAEAVKIFLVNLGINPNRLNTKSYGERRPIATGQNEASWAKNRRAQFVINRFPYGHNS